MLILDVTTAIPRLTAFGRTVAGLRSAIADPGGHVVLVLDPDAVAVLRQPPYADGGDACRPSSPTDGHDRTMVLSPQAFRDRIPIGGPCGRSRPGL